MRLLGNEHLLQPAKMTLRDHDVELERYTGDGQTFIGCRVSNRSGGVGFVRARVGVRGVEVVARNCLTKTEWVLMPNLDEAIIYLKLLGGTRG